MNPNWWEAGSWLCTQLGRREEFNSELPRTNPGSSGMEDEPGTSTCQIQRLKPLGHAD